MSPDLLADLITADAFFCHDCGIGMTVTKRAAAVHRERFEVFRGEHEGHEVERERRATATDGHRDK